MPPTKPTLPVLEASAAAMPTRKLPSCSLNTTDWTLGSSTTESMITNLVSGNSLATFSSGVEKREADRDHDVGAALGHAPQRLIALGLVGDLELEIVDAGLVLEPLGTGVGGLVERLVELAAHVEDDRRGELRRGGDAGDQHGRGGEGGEQAPSHPSPLKQVVVATSLGQTLGIATAFAAAWRHPRPPGAN